MRGGAATLAAFRQRLATVSEAARREANAALQAIGDDVTAEARRSLRASAAGAPVSAPGAPPRDPSGDLAASLAAEVDPATQKMTVTSHSPQAAVLEYGTRRMAARPFLRPAVAASREAALQHCRQAMARVITALRRPG